MSFDIKIVNGDFVIENSGIATITGQDKLVQDILKIVLTDVGSNPLVPWYGSLVGQSLIGNYLETDIVFSMAKSQLQQALQNLKDLQDLQVASGQKVTPDEMLSFIKDISIQRNPTDLRLYQVQIKVLSRSFGQVSVSLNL